MPRGRPTRSIIRQNIVNILAVIGKAYGYQIHKLYIRLYAPCTREVIYYHLKKGAQLGEFVLEEIKQEKGEYSWGTSVEKNYYRIGPNAKPKIDLKLQEHVKNNSA
ncbi:MAG: hypothetical protein HY363_06235 [Candidatus Aenigmarchaeota archaeon]|nr:hypothetical protein [Candidatus Aenigmarchaeota archaeon]